MAPRKAKPKTRARTAYKKRAPVRRTTPADGQSILVSTYLEVRKNLAADESSMSYSICLDPKVGAIIAGNGEQFADGTGGAGAVVASGSNLSFNKYNTFASIFNEYKVNSATIKIRTDATCGLENAVICSNDKGNSGAPANMASALQGAHKSFSMTASKRELTYGCKNVGQELDFRSTNGDTTLVDGAKKYIKVFQKLPAMGLAGTAAAPNPLHGHVCEHQVQIMLSLTLKDSKNSLN